MGHRGDRDQNSGKESKAGDSLVRHRGERVHQPDMDEETSGGTQEVMSHAAECC